MAENKQYVKVKQAKRGKQTHFVLLLTEHAKIRHSDGTALELMRLQFAIACFGRQFLYCLIDFNQTLAIGLRNNWCDQTFVRCNGNRALD